MFAENKVAVLEKIGHAVDIDSKHGCGVAFGDRYAHHRVIGHFVELHRFAKDRAEENFSGGAFPSRPIFQMIAECATPVAEFDAQKSTLPYASCRFFLTSTSMCLVSIMRRIFNVPSRLTKIAYSSGPPFCLKVGSCGRSQ